MGYYDDHRDDKLDYQRYYNDINRDKYLQYQREYFQKNKERIYANTKRRKELFGEIIKEEKKKEIIKKKKQLITLPKSFTVSFD